MIKQNKLFLKTMLVLAWFNTSSTQNTSVLIDASTLLKHNTDIRRKALVKNLQTTIRKSYSTLALWKTVRNAFDVPFFCPEHAVRSEFFKFLNGIKLEQDYPVIISEGDQLPPLLAAWTLGRLDGEQAISLADSYINKKDCSDENKKFYHALVYVTFDSEITKSTRFINNKIQKIFNLCQTHAQKLYLVGHCDRASGQWLQDNCTELLSLFDKVLLSHQLTTLPKHFSDHFWLEKLGLANTIKQQEYIYISDWNNGVKKDDPPHYMSTSKTLIKLLSNR